MRHLGARVIVAWGLSDSPLLGVSLVLLIVGLSAFRYHFKPYKWCGVAETAACIIYAFFWLPALLGLWLSIIAFLEQKWDEKKTELLKNEYSERTELLKLRKSYENSELQMRKVAHGAEGYLLKSTPADGIIERIRAVEKGAMVFDKGVKLTAESKTEKRTDFPELTERENEILSLVATGLSNGEIAAQLFLSPGTVRNAVSVILEKLSLRDRTQLAVYYWRKQ